MVRTVLFCAFVGWFGAIGSGAAYAQQPADPPAIPELAGVYDCNGINPDGSTYHALVEIAKVENTYRVLWALDDNTAILGVGIFSGGVFAVSYFGGAPAVVVYQIQGDRLVGEWTIGGREGAVYAETLTRMSGHPPVRSPGAPSPAPPRIASLP